MENLTVDAECLCALCHVTAQLDVEGISPEGWLNDAKWVDQCDLWQSVTAVSGEGQHLSLCLGCARFLAAAAMACAKPNRKPGEAPLVNEMLDVIRWPDGS